MSDTAPALRELRVKLQRLASSIGQPFDENILDDAAAEIESLRSRLALRELERDTARELLKDKKARLAEQGDVISQLRFDLAEADALLLKSTEALADCRHPGPDDMPSSKCPTCELMAENYAYLSRNG